MLKQSFVRVEFVEQHLVVRLNYVEFFVDDGRQIQFDLRDLLGFQAVLGCYLTGVECESVLSTADVEYCHFAVVLVGLFQ